MKKVFDNKILIIVVIFFVIVFLGIAGIFAYRFSTRVNLDTKTIEESWLPISKHIWPGFHGNYNHTGYANVIGPKKADLKWKFKMGKMEGNSPNSIAISEDGTIYIAGVGKIFALNKDGKERWSKPYKNPQGPSISKEGNIYFVNNDSVVSLDKDGNERWQYKTGGNTIFGPTVGPDGTIYQGSWDKYFYAINPDGTMKWKYKTVGSVSYPSSIGPDGTIYLGGGDAHSGPDGNLYAFNADGALKWKYDTETMRVGSPAIGSDGLIYVAASPSLFVFDKNGNLLWKKQSKESSRNSNIAYAASECGPPPLPPCGGSDNVQSQPNSQNQPPNQPQDQSRPQNSNQFPSPLKDEIAGIITPAISPEGIVYIGSAQGIIYGLDSMTQKVKWTFQTGADPKMKNFYGLPSFPLVDKDGVVYVGSVDGKMYAISKDGKLMWEYQTGGRITEASPAFGADGTLYFTSEDGYLYAIKD